MSTDNRGPPAHKGDQEWEDTLEDTFTDTAPIAKRWREVVRAAAAVQQPARPLIHTPLGPGTKVGRYELVVQLARGGMATVWSAWRARRDGSPEVIALKTLLPNLSQDQSFVHMFLDEARLLSQINHPNVV